MGFGHVLAADRFRTSIRFHVAPGTLHVEVRCATTDCTCIYPGRSACPDGLLRRGLAHRPNLCSSGPPSGLQRGINDLPMDPARHHGAAAQGVERLWSRHQHWRRYHDPCGIGRRHLAGRCDARTGGSNAMLHDLGREAEASAGMQTKWSKCTLVVHQPLWSLAGCHRCRQHAGPCKGDPCTGRRVSHAAGDNHTNWSPCNRRMGSDATEVMDSLPSATSILAREGTSRRQSQIAPHERVSGRIVLCWRSAVDETEIDPCVQCADANDASRIATVAISRRAHPNLF